jgi:glycosyltransferase involved in cell wall biosynthesis
MLDDYPLKLVALNVKHCEVVVATSQRIKRELEAICAADTLPHVVVKPNGIDTRQFDAGARTYTPHGQTAYVVSVCRIEPKKGLRYLVDAMALLRELRVGAELHILGAPDDHDEASLAYASELRAQVTRMGLESLITFEGRRTGTEVQQFLSRADVFVAPFVELENGDKDGISTALFEAMASGCPIVATDSGSSTEAIEADKDGLIVAQRDPAALAAAIRTLLSDPALRERLGRSAAARATREFDVAQCEGILHEHIRNAIERRPS